LIVACFLILAFVLPLRPIDAEEPTRYTLQQLLDSALEHNVDIAVARWKIAGADARLRKVRAARFLPRLRIDSENGLVPEAKGDIFNISSDTTGVRPLGPFTRTELKFIQPIYPVGRGRQLKKAAENGVGVERADLDQARVSTVGTIKEYYYGFLLAQDLLDLTKRLTDELSQRQSELQDDDSLPMSSRYKLSLALIELEKQQRAATSQRDLARDAIAWQAGLPEQPPLAFSARWLAPVEAQVPPLEGLLQEAVSRRPEWRKLQAGIAAKMALREAARAAYKPQVFIGGGVRYAVAPGRTDQRNPFVKDEFNSFSGAIFLGVRQSLEWHLMGADLAKARAEYRELTAMEASALQGIRTDVRRAHAAYLRADADLHAARQSRKLSRQWLKEAKEEYEFDPSQIKELISAFESWAQIEQNYFQAIYDFNMSLADLEQTTGGLALSQENADALQTD